MAYLKTHAILTSVREVLVDSCGELRTVPLGRLSGDLPEGLSELAEEMRTLEAPRVEATIKGKRISPTSPPIGGNLRIYEIDVEVRIVRLVEPLSQLDDLTRIELQALASEDGDVIAQALEGGNLIATQEGDETDLLDGMLMYLDDSTAIAGDIDSGAQTISTIHNFRGIAKSRPAIA